MKISKMVFLLVFASVVVCAGLFASGQNEPVAKSAQSGGTVTTVTLSSYATKDWYKKMNAAFTEQTGIKVAIQPVPGNDIDNVIKVNTDLLAGGNVDVVATLGARDFDTRVQAGFFAPLTKLVADAGVDANAVWGKYLPRDQSGEFYGLPYKQELSCVYYNKAIFDKAGVPYPTAPWTWTDYVNTARRLTDASKGVYGIQNRLEVPGILFQAMQKKVPFYKADGTSNFDDPAFAASLKWYYDLGNVQKYQMSVRQLRAANASWDYWATVANQGMFIQGNWFMRVLNNTKDYPRNWDYGIVAVPTAGTPDGANDFTSMSFASVNKNAAHPVDATRYAIWLGENQWKYENGLPALVNLTDEQKTAAFKSMADASNGNVTVADIDKAFIDNSLGVVNTDIVGPAAAEYNKIILQESEKYFLDQQDLRTTVRQIKSRADEAIANSK